MQDLMKPENQGYFKRKPGEFLTELRRFPNIN